MDPFDKPSRFWIDFVQEALRLAKYDEEQLLKARKLVLVVDLDMTLIHTTVQPVPKGTKVS